MPPKHGDNSKNAGSDEHENQCRILDPRNCRDAERHDQTEQADLPGKDMYAGGKRAKRQQRKNRNPGSIGRQNSLNTRQQYEIDHHQERQPVKQLRAYQPDSAGSIACGMPPVCDTHHPDDGRQNLPINDDRLL